MEGRALHLGGIPALDAQGDFSPTCRQAAGSGPDFTIPNGYYIWPKAVVEAMKDICRRHFPPGEWSIYVHGHSTGGPFVHTLMQRVENVRGLIGIENSPFGSIFNRMTGHDWPTPFNYLLIRTWRELARYRGAELALSNGTLLVGTSAVDGEEDPPGFLLLRANGEVLRNLIPPPAQFIEEPGFQRMYNRTDAQLQKYICEGIYPSAMPAWYGDVHREAIEGEDGTISDGPIVYVFDDKLITNLVRYVRQFAVKNDLATSTDPAAKRLAENPPPGPATYGACETTPTNQPWTPYMRQFRQGRPQPTGGDTPTTSSTDGADQT